MSPGTAEFQGDAEAPDVVLRLSGQCQVWDLRLLLGILALPSQIPLDLFCWINEQVVGWGQGWFLQLILVLKLLWALC